MAFRIPAASLASLRDAIDELTSAWENISDDVETWLQYQEAPPTDADGREERRQAREQIDSYAGDVVAAIHQAALIANLLS